MTVDPDAFPGMERMDERRAVRISKFLAELLRHRPERIGLTLDAEGWADVTELLTAAARVSFPFTRAELDHVVAANDKKRFELDGNRIRAVQGHSVPVELNLSPVEPPPILYHGTVDRSLESIRRDGLRCAARHIAFRAADAAPGWAEPGELGRAGASPFPAGYARTSTAVTG